MGCCFSFGALGYATWAFGVWVPVENCGKSVGGSPMLADKSSSTRVSVPEALGKSVLKPCIRRQDKVNDLGWAGSANCDGSVAVTI